MGAELEAWRLQVGKASLNAMSSAATLTRPPARRIPPCSAMHAMRRGLRFVSQACFEHCECPLDKVGDQPQKLRHKARQSLTAACALGSPLTDILGESTHPSGRDRGWRRILGFRGMPHRSRSQDKMKIV